jgi:hypothetical protein
MDPSSLSHGTRVTFMKDTLSLTGLLGPMRGRTGL